MAKGFSPDTSGTLTTSLVSYWALDEASGNRADSKGSNTLQVESAPGQAASGVGSLGDCATFDGTDDCLKITDAAQTGLDFAGDFSFSFWLKMATQTGNTGSKSLITKDAASNRSFQAFSYDEDQGVDSRKIGFYVNDTSGVFSATQLTANTWYHVVFTYDYATSGTSVMKWYINGSADGTPNTTAVGPMANLGADFQLMARQYTTSRLFCPGSLMHVGAWSKVLSQQEITDLYNSGNGNAYRDLPSSTSPMWFLLNQASSATASAGTGTYANYNDGGYYPWIGTWTCEGSNAYTADSQRLDVDDWGFAIPAGATILGIQAQVTGTWNGIATGDYWKMSTVKLIKGGVVGGTNNGTSTDWVAATTTYTYGGPTDPWGQTWTPADINAADFGVAFKGAFSGAGNVKQAEINTSVVLKVYYA